MTKRQQNRGGNKRLYMTEAEGRYGGGAVCRHRICPLLILFSTTAFLDESVREALIKAFPSPDLRHEVTISTADPCEAPEAAKEALNESVLP